MMHRYKVSLNEVGGDNGGSKGLSANDIVIPAVYKEVF